MDHAVPIGTPIPSPAEVAAFAAGNIDPQATKKAPDPIPPPTKQAHEGLAPGATVLDGPTLRTAFAAFIARTETHEIVRAGKKVAVVRHETDPHDNYVAQGTAPQIGPLPVLMDEVPKGSTFEKHEHYHGPVPASEVERVAHHFCRVFAVEARRIQAKGIVIRDPVLAAGALSIETVLVLS